MSWPKIVGVVGVILEELVVHKEGLPILKLNLNGVIEGSLVRYHQGSNLVVESIGNNLLVDHHPNGLYYLIEENVDLRGSPSDLDCNQVLKVGGVVRIEGAVVRVDRSVTPNNLPTKCFDELLASCTGWALQYIGREKSID